MRLIALLLATIISAAHADSLHGKLTDEKGAALAGATVRYLYFDRQAEPAKRLRSFDVRTTADGSFQFDDFTQFQALPLVFGVYLPNHHLATFTLPKDGATAVVADRQTTLKFIVQDAKGRPLRGAQVAAGGIMVENPGKGAFTMSTGLKQLSTGPDGTAEVSPVPLGVTVLYEASSDKFASVSDRIRTDGPTEVKVVMRRPVTLSGRVTFEGHPVAGADVSATSSTFHDGMFFGEGGGSAKTGPDGRYRLEAKPGTIEVKAETSEGLVCPPFKGVHAVEGDELDGIDLALCRKVVVTGRLLVKETNKPVAGATIQVNYSSEIRSRTDGTFSVPVVPGSLSLKVTRVGDQKLDFEPPSVDATIDAQHNPPLTLFVPSQSLLPPIKDLHGLVKSADGHPVAGAKVFIQGKSKSVASNADGRFQIAGVLNPGEKIYAVTPDRVTGTMTTLLDQNQLDLVLDSPTGLLTGKVVDDTGAPVADAVVDLYGQRDNYVFDLAKTHTDAQGAYRFDGLTAAMPGYGVRASKPGYGKYSAGDLVAKPGLTIAVKDMVITLADTTIKGRLLDSAGRPLAGIAVMCGDQGASSDSHGEFTISQVPRGKVFLVVPANDGYYGSASAVGGQADIVIKLDKVQDTPGEVVQNMEGQKAAPLRAGRWLGDAKLDLGSLKGKIVVLDLWAVWCSPCVAALPEVQALADKYKGSNVVVLGIHVAGTPFEKANAFVRDHHLRYPILLDPDGAPNLTAFPAKGIPQLFVIGPDGRIECDTHDVSAAAETVEKLLRASRD